MGAFSDLGKVCMKHRGTYDASTAYEELDIVEKGGSAYIAVKDGTGHPVTDTTYWHLLVAAGSGGGGGISTVDGVAPGPGQSDVELMLVGHGAPTASTSAQYKQRYLDADSGVLYVCMTQSGTTYNWIPVGMSAKVENEILKFTV